MAHNEDAQIMDEEKEILAEWMPGVDLSKVKIRAGPRIDMICNLFGRSAITIGNSIFVAGDSWIMKYDAGHPVRLSLIAHELFHVKHEQEKGLVLYLVQYNSISAWLIVLATPRYIRSLPSRISAHIMDLAIKFATKFFGPTLSRLASFIGENHPYERPAYKLQAEFLEKNWTIEEAKKWKGVAPK